MEPGDITPLGQVSYIMRGFGYCMGYPLRMSHNGDVSLSFFCLLNTILPCLFKLAPMVIVGAYLGNLQEKAAEVKLILQELGLSSLDAVTQFLLIFITAISIVWHILCTIMSRKDINEFNRFMGKASKYFGERSRVIAIDCRKRGERGVWATVACGCLFSVLTCTCWFELARGLVDDHGTALVLAFVMVLQAFLGFFAPVVIAGEFLVMYLVNYTAGHLKEWTIMMVGRGKNQTALVVDTSTIMHSTVNVVQNHHNQDHASPINKPTFDLEEHLLSGLALCKGISRLNCVIGDCVFNVFLTNTLSAVLSSYASLTVIFSSAHSHVPGLFSLTQFVLTALFVGRLYMLTHTGQGLIRALETSREALEDHLVLRQLRHGDPTSAHSLDFTADVLRSRLDASRSSISPLNFFTLSKVGFVSGLGTIITYIIVLMQFKAAE